MDLRLQQFTSMMQSVEWELAKGHLKAILHLFMSDSTDYKEGEAKFKEMKQIIDEFIEKVEMTSPIA
jgi:cobalamin-dependent methionine synthase I